MSRLACNYELLEELKAHTDQAKGHMYLIRTIISSYQAIPPVKNCAAMTGLIASSELLFNNCGAANAGALDAALICTSLGILHYELAKLERLHLYAKLLRDRQTVTILNAVLHDSIETKHRLAELLDLCVDLDSVSAPKSTPLPADMPALAEPPVDRPATDFADKAELVSVAIYKAGKLSSVTANRQPPN